MGTATPLRAYPYKEGFRPTKQHSSKKWDSRHKRLQEKRQLKRKEDKLVDKALSQVGSRYVWGGASPGAFDCSGLVMWTYGGLPHHANDQLYIVKQKGLFVTKRRRFEPGMIVFYGYGSATHAGIYIGHGRIVNALNTSTGVVVQPVDAQYVGSPIIGAGFPKWPLT